ncbi:thymidine phosphorylase [Pseudooceanicola batsensis HTCC2597]|uniref:Thymidine phosphorylase n=1 Tax=Pseudooceanicola batsensis (strain ATCC BAA-863 / DSM 15984 / KCTC 12145 / HTCC2597) TaxID=252305 RepID=A3TTA3_PSEBH|nr:thymidine phosphorylase [Pseudooceanicola batsensis]EAQ04880.1 thymidine phosphorylase [Pseudooceanicola batsensis HTCC2597]
MDARRIIARLRDGETPARAELQWFAQGLADGQVTDAQAGAFAMAALLNGMADEGRVALTMAMRDSGRVLHWDFDGPVLDKHSTGGVGDCVSLVLAPALAACGAHVPMISGRGLGHTGGTLDKMEAIPGVVTALDETRFREVVRKAGCAIVSATTDIAPADRRLYAIRDVTSTVESLDLITASILSKKLAAGLDGLVLDVKIGSGAFMKQMDEAKSLAEALVTTANEAGCRTAAVISDMSQPLAPALGNALEVAASCEVLTGRSEGALLDLSATLGGVVLAGAGLAEDVAGGHAAILAAISSGAAAERFGRMVAAMGGPVQFIEDPARYLPEATVIREIPAPADGYVAEIDGQALGMTVVDLGGGRHVESDAIDYAVGLSDMLPLGTRVRRGDTLGRVHASRMESAAQAAREVQAAIILSEGTPEVPPLIRDGVG